MKSPSRITRGLRVGALVLFLSGLGLWAGTGARFGWTQTSTVQMQRDEITGIDYPVRRAAFIPGIEVPVAAAVAAALLASLSLFRAPPQSAPQP